MRSTLLALLVILCPMSMIAQTGKSTLVYIGANGKLEYKADSKGNKIPDFSYAGYMHSEKPIPTAPVVKTITAVSGDNLANIQNAINEAGNRSLDANGLRGAVLLKAGTYNVNGTITINKSGIVLIGEGSNTKIVATKTSQHDLITLGGSAPVYNSSRFKITDNYVAIGARTVTVASGHSFKAGDRIILERKPNQAWISLLGMDQLEATGVASQTNWTTASYTFRYKRVVMAVNGNQITFDAPVVDPIDPQYAEGFLYTYNWAGKVENSGVENLYLDSYYANSTDENHGWTAVKINNAENCWVRNVEAHHFGYSTVYMTSGSYKITVINCKYLDPVSQITGGRRYSFHIGGQQCLVKDCYTKSGRHDYVMDARVPGPNVFYNCKAEDQKNDIGPHQRWSTGVLHDNLTGNGEMNVRNRWTWGSGHGWAGAQNMFWNCKAGKFILHDPPGDHVNWAIGCTGTITNKNASGLPNEPVGFSESTNIPVLPKSLFEKQLEDRLNISQNQVPAVSITSPANNTAFIAPASVTINVSATDNDGTISKVDFYNGTTLLSSDNSTPYSFTWSGVVAGTYNITAKATDNVGAVTTSATVSVKVNSQANTIPLVNITSPGNNTVFIAPASVTINANATDSDGTISKVDFYNGAALLSSDNSAPYSFTWSGVVAGTYNITAKATDNAGATTTSAAIVIVVNTSANLCTGINQYIENGNYIAGSKVQNAGGLYECKSYPYTGWCNGAAWAYAPGTGTYWTDAWIKTGTCTSAKKSITVAKPIMEIYPNPTVSSSVIKLTNTIAIDAEVIVLNSMGLEIYQTKLDQNAEGIIDLSEESSGIYIIQISAGETVWIEKIIKQ